MFLNISMYLQIKPLSGPIEGGTLITIEGSNLGLKEIDVKGKIRIGNVQCELVNYEVSVKIECLTGMSDGELIAPVVVGNEAGFTESSVQFSYKVSFYIFVPCKIINILLIYCRTFNLRVYTRLSVPNQVVPNWL